MPNNIIIKSIQNNYCSLRQDAIIVFVCGKDIKSSESKRKIFIEYAQKHLKNYHFLLAESFFSVANSKNNLLTIEDNLTKYSDCIIIILESESSFAELGAFTIKDRLAPLIIPVNNKLYKGIPSFINRGPLDKIDKINKGMGPTIYADMDAFAMCFSEIENRLTKITRKQKKRIEINTFDKFNKLNKERLLLMHDIISLCSPITKSEIITILKSIYGEKRFDPVHTDTNLLESLRLIFKMNDYLIASNPGLRFINFPGDAIHNIKARCLANYKKNYPDRLKVLAKYANNA